MRVLFLGNSQIVCNCNLPKIVHALFKSTSEAKLDSEEVVIGGASIQKIWDDGRARQKLETQTYDWVLCHEIVYSYGGNTARFHEYARKLHAVAKPSGARMLFYASGDVEGQRAQHEPMYSGALALARELGGRVAGGGMAWLKAWQQRPELDFHCSDRAHASEQGYYLNACVIFAALTDRSPVGLDSYTLPHEQAAFLQAVAWDQYKDDRQRERGVME
jgi:hypothetical protein